MARRSAVVEPEYAHYAEKEATPLQVHYADWLREKTGVDVDEESVKLATALRMVYQASDENKERRAQLAEERAAEADERSERSETRAKRKRGRPAAAPVEEEAEDELAPRRGRPRKSAAAAKVTGAKRRGRPRKAAPVVEEEYEDVEE